MDNKNDSLIGKQLGIYQVQASLGQGGMARVYKAYHPHLRREVAIKVILAESADRANFQARFKLEAQMIASLEHPHIVHVYDFGEEGDLAYLVMQYVSGGTLREQLQGNRPLEPQRATSYAIQMAQALHHAHQHGIIHRDVKPQNMLVSSTDRNQLLLSDFGIAKLYYESNEPTAFAEMPTRGAFGSELTSASQIIGTADYMAPEQASGQTVDARTDVYALGIVLFQMLTGDKPFHSASLHGLLVQHVATPAPWVSASNPHVPETLSQITAKALAKAPADRFQTAEEMALALEQASKNITRTAYPFVAGGSVPLSSAQTMADNAAPRAFPLVYPPTSPQTNSYATIPAPQTQISRERVTAPSNAAWAPAHTDITGQPAPHKARHPFSIVSLLTVLAILVSLVVAGLYWLPGLNTKTTTLATNNGTMKPFDEQFQNNQRNWLVGNVAPGISISTPGGGAYTVTISTNTTAFPYPQAVSLLPDAFTLAATLQQTAGAADDTYGLAFHLTEDSSGQISCYALIINNSGSYEIVEYTSNNLSMITRGTYQASTRPHTLAVKARSSSYSFSIDQQALSITVGTQAASTTWNNGDLSGGHLALLFAGPNKGEAATTFEATDVQLSLP